MSAPAAADAIVYSWQILIVVAAASIAETLLRPAPARGRLSCWRAVVALCLALPLLPVFGSYSAPAGGPAPGIQFALTAPAIALGPSRWLFGLVPAALVCGALARAAYLALGLLRLRQLRAASTPIVLDADVATLAVSIAPRAEFRSHPSITQPVTFGWRRPVVLVPLSLTRLPIAAQRGAVLHEAFHVARHDWLNVLAEQLVQTMFWFHPAMWWAVDRIRLSREQVIDDLVVGATADRRSYMSALLAFAGVMPAAALTAPFLGQRHLSRRIRAIAAQARPSRKRSLVAVAGLGVMTAAAALGATSAFPLQTAKGRVYEPGNGVSLPAVVSEVHAVYTPAAKQARIQGTVLLNCVVQPNGTPASVIVARSLDPVHGLDQAAVAALRQWRFTPGTKDGKPVPVRVHVEMTFALK